MSVNLSLLSQLQIGALGFSNLLLVNPQDDRGISPQVTPADKFLFADVGFEGEQSLDVISESTDHYIEDNTAIQNNIAIKPITYRTQGFVAELNDVVPGELGNIARFLSNKLKVISAYTPELSVSAQIAYNNAFQAYQLQQTISSTVKSWGGANQTKQQLAFQKLAGYIKRRVLFTVQTPWCVLTNMSGSLHAVQDAETRLVSEFTMSFKQMQFVVTDVQIVQDDGSRYYTQADGSVTIGANKPAPAEASQVLVVQDYGT